MLTYFDLQVCNTDIASKDEKMKSNQRIVLSYNNPKDLYSLLQASTFFYIPSLVDLGNSDQFNH